MIISNIKKYIRSAIIFAIYSFNIFANEAYKSGDVVFSEYQEYYTISNVEAKVVSMGNLIIAKQKAIKQANKIAFLNLQYAIGNSIIFLDSEIESLIDKFEVENETFNKNQYEGVFKFYFNKANLSYILNAKQNITKNILSKQKQDSRFFLNIKNEKDWAKIKKMLDRSMKYTVLSISIDQIEIIVHETSKDDLQNFCKKNNLIIKDLGWITYISL